MYFTEGGLKFLTLSSIWYTWKFTVVNAPLNVQCPADSQNEFYSAHSVGWQVGDLLAIVLFAFVITGILWLCQSVKMETFCCCFGNLSFVLFICVSM